MHTIDEKGFSREFAEAWVAAGKHLNNKAGGSIPWIRTSLTQPLIEHLSFRMGNRLFFIFLEAAEQRIEAYLSNYLAHCHRVKAIPCVMKMDHSSSGWEPAWREWGLRHAETGLELDPVALIDEEKIEISDWELQDFCVKRLVDEISSEEGCKVLGFNSDPEIFPSCIFEREGELFYVILAAARYPIETAAMPVSTPKIMAHLSGRTAGGYFASISVANVNDAFDPDSCEGYPLYRGDGYYIRYSGLIPLQNHAQLSG